MPQCQEILLSFKRGFAPDPRTRRPDTREAAQFIRALRDSEVKTTGEAGKRQKENQKMKYFRIP